jgi:dUTP pyrophosphatase
LSATAVRWWADQHSVPTQPEPPFTFELEQVSHQPLLVSGAAANLRQRAYPGDAGLDLTLSHGLVLFDQHYTMAGTGVHVAIPEGYWGLITGRSSTWAKYRCDVRQAVIDSGYRGELMVGIENRSGQSVEFAAGTRLAQLVLLPIWPGEVVPVETLPDHERGHNGYGSSDDRTEQLPAVS